MSLITMKNLKVWPFALPWMLLSPSSLVSAIDPAVVLPDACQDVQPRFEIRELAQNQDQWNVFLLGLKRMQEVEIRDPTGYYAIAGKR